MKDLLVGLAALKYIAKPLKKVPCPELRKKDIIHLEIPKDVGVYFDLVRDKKEISQYVKQLKKDFEICLDKYGILDKRCLNSLKKLKKFVEKTFAFDMTKNLDYFTFYKDETEIKNCKELIKYYNDCNKYIYTYYSKKEFEINDIIISNHKSSMKR